MLANQHIVASLKFHWSDSCWKQTSLNSSLGGVKRPQVSGSKRSVTSGEGLRLLEEQDKPGQCVLAVCAATVSV
jgi:hypothetical protein